MKELAGVVIIVIGIGVMLFFGMATCALGGLQAIGHEHYVMGLVLLFVATPICMSIGGTIAFFGTTLFNAVDDED